MAQEDKKLDKADKTGSLKNYFKGVKSERKKIIWPTKKTIINYTIVVIVMSALISTFIFALDFIFNSAVTGLMPK